MNTKRIVSFLLTLLMVWSMIGTFAVSAETTQPTALPDGTVFVDLSWSESATPASITVNGKAFALTWGTNAFGNAQTAVDTVAAGSTVYLAAGTYSDAITIKKNITLLGAKYGIDPNTKGAAENTKWTLSASRGSDETIITGTIHMGVSAATVYDANNITIDGIKIAGAGQLRSNSGTAGSAKLTLKNIYIKDNTATVPPLYLEPYWYSGAGNLYIRDVTIENLRIEGQTKKEVLALSADKAVISGVYMDSDCTQIFLPTCSASSTTVGGTTAIDWIIRDSMFCAPVYRVMYLNWDTTQTKKGSPAVNLNETLPNRTKVTTTVTNCVFVDCYKSSTNYTLAQRQNTANTYYNYLNNAFYQSAIPSAAHACLAGYSEEKTIDYASKITVKGNKFIGNINLAWTYSAAGGSVDLNGNYCEDASGKSSYLYAGGPNIQDWWYLDAAMTRRSDAGADNIPAEQVVDMETQVKWLGRTYVADARHYFNWTNSGFEFNINGTGATALLSSNNPSTNQAYLKVYVDGVYSKTVKMDWPTMAVTLAENLSDGNHTIKVIKRTNGRSSTAALKKLWVDEGTEILAPNKQAERTMQFVGDSITVGYGSMDELKPTEWSTDSEDGSITYAALTGQYFGADYHTIAVSGRGIVKNVGGDTSDYAPLMYEYTDWNNHTDWDHSGFVPDVIVINYGTNDNSAGVSAADFKVGCKAFVEQVRKDNPTSTIIYAYGFMGDAYKTQVEEVVGELNAAGDENVYYLYLTPITAEEKSLGHPTSAAHADRAQTLIAKVKEVTGWDQHTECSYDANVLTAASCYQAGNTEYTCKVCGDYYEATVAATGEHVYAETLTQGESTHYYACTTPGCTAKKDEEAHVAGKLIVDTPATCAKEGAGHKECVDCGAVVESGVIGTNSNHTPGAWKVTKKATYTTEGLKEQYCSACGELLDVQTIPTTGVDTLTVFKDIKKKDWFVTNGAIDFAYNMDLFKGTSNTTFGPGENMTRAMFVTVLGRLSGVKVDHKQATKFTDVKTKQYYTGYVRWAAANGIVNGTDETKFSPEANITREQICAMMVRYASYAKITLKKVNPTVTFKDANKISGYAKAAVKACQQGGVVSGEKDGNGYNFRPQGNASRAEVATIIMNFYNSYLA